MRRPVEYTATLYSGGVELGYLTASTLKELQELIYRDWLSLLDEGDTITIGVEED